MKASTSFQAGLPQESMAYRSVSAMAIAPEFRRRSLVIQGVNSAINSSVVVSAGSSYFSE